MDNDVSYTVTWTFIFLYTGFVGMAVLFRYTVLSSENIDALVLALIVLAVFVISKDRNGTGLLLETGLFISELEKLIIKRF